MTLFGFIIGTTLVNSLFLFDLCITKFQQQQSLWGSTMTVVFSLTKSIKVIPIYTLIVLWTFGLLYGDHVTNLQLIASVLFWLWYFYLYFVSTFLYYKWKVFELKQRK